MTRPTRTRAAQAATRRRGRLHLAGVAATFALLAWATERVPERPAAVAAHSADDVWSRVTTQPWTFFSTISVKRPCGAWPVASPDRASCHLPNT